MPWACGLQLSVNFSPTGAGQELGNLRFPLWDWQIGAGFTPGSLASGLFFLSRCQLHIKTPSDCLLSLLQPHQRSHSLQSHPAKIPQFGGNLSKDELTQSKSGL